MLDHESGSNVLSTFSIMRLPPARAPGFTLIEVLVVVAIIAISAILGIPSYRAWVQNTQIYNATESALNGLQKAQAEAVKRNTSVEFVLGPTYLWQIQLPGNTLSCPVNSNNPLTTLLECSTSDGAKNVTRKATLLNGTVQNNTFSANPSQATTITFSNLGGITSNVNTTMMLSQIDFNSAVLPTTSRYLRITIGVGGNVRMCDPNLATGSSPRAC